MNNNFSKKLLFTVVVTSFIAEAIPVMAQIEEVVITARKREESILKVPVTVSVLDGDTLDQYAIGGVKGVADQVPGLNFGSSTVAAGVQVSMRGVGTSTFNASSDQSVALVVDGVQFTQGLAYMAATFDMAQVEVLKGPQALFFGKAAPAGVISISTADPGEIAEVSLRAGYEFEGEEKLSELIVSGPVTDALGLRLAAQYSDKEGYFENTANPVSHPVLGDSGAAPTKYKDFPNEDSLLLRGTALWQPTDRFRARLKVNYGDFESQGGSSPQITSCPEGTSSFIGNFAVPIWGPPAFEFIGGADCKLDKKFQFAYLDPAFFPAGLQNDGIPFQKFRQNFESLELTYDLSDDLSLTSVTGYYDVDQESGLNIATTTVIGPVLALQGNLDRQDMTQEFRLASNYAGPVNYTVGAFFHHGESSYLNALSANQAELYTFFWTTFAGFTTPPLTNAYGKSEVTTRAESVFGQVRWQMTQELELGAGARWSSENRNQDYLDMAPVLEGGNPTEVTLAVPEIRSTNWSPEVSLTYTPTDTFTVYGNLKQAYKSGSFNSSGTPPEGDDTSFDDERVRGGEIGLKTRLLDQSLAFNLSTYYYKFNDMQVEANVFAPATGTSVVRTVNAASSKVYGVDADFTYIVSNVEGLTLFGAANWNKAEYTDFSNAKCWNGQLWQQGCDIDFIDASLPSPIPGADGIGDAQDLKGAPLLRAPEWAANIGLDYERLIFDGMTLRFGSSVSYSDAYSAGIEDLDSMYQDSYTKVNASMSLSSRDDRWKVDLIGENLTDKIVVGNCNQGTFADGALGDGGTGSTVQGVSGQPEISCFPERGRSLWLRLTWNIL